MKESLDTNPICESVDITFFGASLLHCLLSTLISQKYGKKVLLVDSTASYGHDCNNGRPDLCADNLDPKGTSLDGMARPFLASEPWIRWIKEFDMTEYFTFKQISGFYFVASLTDGLPLIRKVPLKKEDIFADTSLGLVEKRKLMKILTAFLEEDLPQDTCIVGDSKSLEAYLDSFDFSTHSIKELLEYGILLNWENTKLTLKEAKERAHLLFTSIGKYQNTSPFLFPLFGWSQLAEGFSRKASVLGTQCMLRTKLSLEDPRSGNEFLLSFDNGTTWKSGLLERDTPAPDTFSSFRFDLKASEENPNLISQEPFFLVIPPSIASCLKGNPAYILFLTRDFYPSEAVDRCYLFSITATFTAEDLDVFLGFAGITTYTTSAESFNSVYGSPNCNSFSLDLLSLQMDAKVRQILSSLHL